MAACRYGISFLVFNLLSRSCQVIYPYFQNFTYCKNYLKDDKHDSLNWAQKYAQIFVLRHNLFLKAHSFPQTALSGNCLLLRTDNIRASFSAKWRQEPVKLNTFTRFFPFVFVVFKDNCGKKTVQCVYCMLLFIHRQFSQS